MLAALIFFSPLPRVWNMIEPSQDVISPKPQTTRSREPEFQFLSNYPCTFIYCSYLVSTPPLVWPPHDSRLEGLRHAPPAPSAHLARLRQGRPDMAEGRVFAENAREGAELWGRCWLGQAALRGNDRAWSHGAQRVSRAFLSSSPGASGGGLERHSYGNAPSRQSPTPGDRCGSGAGHQAACRD